MTKTIKVKILGVLVILAVVLECVGVYKMAGGLLGGGNMRGAGFVIVGFILGVPTVIARQFFLASPDTSLDKDKIALETLAKLSKNNRKTH